MLTKTQTAIIAYLLANPEEPHTIRGIARALKKSYTLTYNNIEDLKKKEIIQKQGAPPATLISLHPFAPIEELMKGEEKRKQDFFCKYRWAKVFCHDVLTQAQSPFFTILVFGSYARGKETKKSDLDLLIIVPAKEDVKRIECVIKNVYTSTKKSLVIITTDDFVAMVRNSKAFNVGNEAQKYHIILYGAEQYYQTVRKEQ